MTYTSPLNFDRRHATGATIAQRVASLAFSFATVALVGAVVSVCTWTIEAAAQTTTSVPGQFLVRLKKPSDRYGERRVERSLNGKVIDRIRNDMVLVQRDREEPVDSALKELKDSPIVAFADPNYVYRASKVPNDPEYGRLWGLNNVGGLDSEGTRGLKGIDIGAERAWDLTTGSREVVVAVIDTGVNFSIPELAANAWTNRAEASGQAGVDDDGNGYVDDINGYDFVSNDGSPMDDNGHGSHVAGTIGAAGNDGRGVVGVSWEVSIMALKFLDRNGGGTLANAVKAIDYARINKARILSNSWGGGGFAQALKDAVELTNSEGQLFVAAAGNEGSDNDRRPTYPANFDSANVVSVAAVDNRGELAFFSNHGARSVHVAAPGVNIVSTASGGTATYSGTSMAAPHVSGVAALLFAAHPSMTAVEAKARLIDHARPLSSLAGRVSSGGMVDAYYAISGEKPAADPNDPSHWSGVLEQLVASPHPYPAKFSETYTIRVPGATRVAAHFLRFETEAIYDKLRFFNAKGEALGSWSGTQNGRYSPVAEGDTLVMKFMADDSIQGFGFEIDKVKYEKP